MSAIGEAIRHEKAVRKLRMKLRSQELTKDERAAILVDILRREHEFAGAWRDAKGEPA